MKRTGVSVVIGFVLLAACGGRTLDEFGDTLDGGGGTSSGGASGGASGNGASSSGFGSSGGTSSGGGTSGGTSGGASSGGGTSSGGTSGTVVDASVPGTIACGKTSCVAGAEECCITFQGGPGGGTANETCTPVGKCQGGVALTCTGSSNCPAGEVCCASFGGGGGGGPGGGGGGAKCAKTCGGGGGPGGGGVQLCNGNGDCPPGEQCVPAPIGGVNICRPQRGPGPGVDAG